MRVGQHSTNSDLASPQKAHAVLLWQAECDFSHVQSVSTYQAIFLDAYLEEITPKTRANKLVRLPTEYNFSILHLT